MKKPCRCCMGKLIGEQKLMCVDTDLVFHAGSRRLNKRALSTTCRLQVFNFARVVTDRSQ